MRKEDKSAIIAHLGELLKEYPHFYMVDVEGMDAATTSELRRSCFDKELKMVVVKNTLLEKALEAKGEEFNVLKDVLKGTTAVLFTHVANAPAKMIKEYKTKKAEKPALKAAYAEEGLYIGAEQLDVRLELAGIAAADAADESLYCLDAHADRLLDALRLILEHQLDDVELLVRAALRERRYLHDVRDAAHEGLRQRGLGVLRRRPDDQDLGSAAALRLAEPVERACIHEIEDHLLPLRRQAVDLIEEQHAAVCLLDEARL